MNQDYKVNSQQYFIKTKNKNKEKQILQFEIPLRKKALTTH